MMRTWAVPLCALAVATTGFLHVRAQGGMHLLTAPWNPHPFFEQLGKEQAAGALLEFPLGLGHATAPDQLIHQRKRSESHHDYIAALQSNNRPEDCYQLPIFDSLWDLSRGAQSAGPSAAEIQDAHNAGFQYLVLWRAGFDVLRQAGLNVDREQSIRKLRGWFGEPTVSDDVLVVWTLERTP